MFSNLTKPRFNLLFMILVIAVVFFTEALTMFYWKKQAEKAAFQNPFPKVIAAERSTFTNPNSYSKQYNFMDSWLPYKFKRGKPLSYGYR